MLRQAGGSLWANRKVVKRSEWADDISNFTSRCSRILRGNLYKDEQHPIYNFIFQYYFSLNPKCLTHFSPGLNVELEDVDSDTATRCLAGVPSAYLPDRSAYLIDRDALPFPSSKVKTMSSVMQLLKAVDSRRPSLRCYGLHEWAMLYRSHITEANNESTVTKLSKFQSLPLRVTAADIQRVLIPDPAVGPILRCTHYDAIRFFTEDAKGLNRITDPVPSRATVSQFEQPGCIHVQMDLFKWAFKLYPYISSSLLLDALEVALAARELDMRASPYDLYSYQPDPKYLSFEPDAENKYNYGFDPKPIFIETEAGKREYQRQQMKLYRLAAPIRRELIAAYDLAAFGNSAGDVSGHRD